MTSEALKQKWLKEESAAQIHGWDFSHIHGRYEEEQDLPWDYETVVRQYLTPDTELLDFDTGGGEFLLSLNHPHHKITATEDVSFWQDDEGNDIVFKGGIFTLLTI